MSRSIVFNFSHVFEGVIWNTVVAAAKDVIILEVRHSDQKQVRFSALNYVTQEFLWKDKTFDEPWWISLSAVSDSIILFTIYIDTSNPDKKSTLAYDLFDCKLIWWNNDFSVTSVSNFQVFGISSKFGTRNVVLDLHTGKEVESPTSAYEKTQDVIRPHQYLADNSYFATVKTFFSQKFNLLPITALEYLEYESMIFISCYLQEDELTNYLIVISGEGELLMKEKLDGHLKGIGLDTFFILSGCVFFVKNKVELVSYKIL